MAGASSLKDRIERRLREVQREAALVREDVRTLRTALRNRDELDRLPKLKSTFYYADRMPPPSRPDPVREKQRSAATVPRKLTEAPVRENVREPMRTPSVAESVSATAKSPPVRGDARFANLFSSGGFFGTAAYSPAEHRVQRNKAIFVAILLILVLFVVINLLTY